MLLHALLILIGLEHSYAVVTSSMQPTLTIGEVYAFRNYRLYTALGPALLTAPPRQGDVIVHEVTPSGELYFTRVIGVGGDVVQMIGGRLHINGEMVERRAIGTVDDADGFGGVATMTKYVQVLPNGVEHFVFEIDDEQLLDSTDAFQVPPGHYFVMGDNHDRSADSRVTSLVGFVPADRVVGRLDNLAAVEIPGR